MYLKQNHKLNHIGSTSPRCEATHLDSEFQEMMRIYLLIRCYIRNSYQFEVVPSTSADAGSQPASDRSGQNRRANDRAEAIREDAIMPLWAHVELHSKDQPLDLLE